MPYFKAKMHEIRFRLGLHPRSRWGSLQRSPGSLAGFKGPSSKGKGLKPILRNTTFGVLPPMHQETDLGRKMNFFHLKWRIFVNFEWNYWSAPLQRTVMQAIWCLTF